jgi:hypothetical protein
MRRSVTLAVLSLFAVPVGVSLTGCHKVFAPSYCNDQTSGVQLGQLTSLTLEPKLSGISLNGGEIGRVNSPTGKDCRGNSASAGGVTFATTNINLADVNPSDGSLCGGSWNRNTGAAIPDFTVCTPSATNGVAYITASAGGVVSNAIPVFIHPIVTSIVLGSASKNCTTDPASNCVDLNIPSAFDSGTPVNTAAAYDGTTCLSQGQTAQLVARTYNGTTNISNQVGPLQFAALNGSVVTIDSSQSVGATTATATQPGSSTITANTSNASSSAGFFSTCPPASIVLSIPPAITAPTGPVSVNQNTSQSILATIKDTNGNPITNLQLSYVSTSPITIPANGTSVTPIYPSTAAITALCQPPACNGSPLNEIGLFNNGTAITSNPILINATGTNFSSVIYVGSTQSQYIQPIDFTVSTQPAPVRLPYAPNTFMLSEDTSTIYMGTDQEIMVYSTLSNALIKQDTTLSGRVISISPDSATVVITDPIRNLIYLYSSSGAIAGEYGGVATRAIWSPDSATVYIATQDGRLLVHSTFIGWTVVNPATSTTDVAVTIPSAGVYLGGNPVDVRTNCPDTTVTGAGLQATTTNVFYPNYTRTGAVVTPLGASLANTRATRLASTSDGLHILGATPTAFTDILTNPKSGGCPVTFTSNPKPPIPFTGLVVDPTVNTAGTSIFNSGLSNVLVTSDSAFAFVTYSGTGGVIPQYNVATGTLSNVALTGTAIAPVSAAISADNKTIYIGTTGDNLVHRLIRGANGFTDSATPVVPALPNINGGTTPATPDFLVQRPRKSTS